MTTSDEDTWRAIPSLQPESSDTSSLESLIELLRGLMASVKITNAMAKQDPETAVISMARVCLKFPLGLIQTIVDRLMQDPFSTWPTAGEMVAMLQAEATKDKPKTKPNAEVPHSRRYEAALRSPQGQRAMERGYGPTFASHVCSRKITLLDADDPAYIRERLAALKERRVMTNQLKQGQLDQTMSPAWRDRLVSLGEAMERKNQDLIKQYYQA